MPNCGSIYIDKFAFSNVKRSKITLVTVTMFTLRAADQLFEILSNSFFVIDCFKSCNVDPL